MALGRTTLIACEQRRVGAWQLCPAPADGINTFGAHATEY